MTHDVRHDAAARRYTLEAGDALAVAEYRREGDVLIFSHTSVPPRLEGQGIASRLIAGALADVRRQHLRIVPACAFVAAYLDRHPQDSDLVARDPR